MIRKLFHSFLNVNAAKSYAPYQDLESKQMLVGLLDEPEKWIGHIKRYSGSLTTQMIFGFRTTSIDDPKMKHLYEEFEQFGAIAGGQAAALLDIYPILRLLPKFMVREYAHVEYLYESLRGLYLGHWLAVKKKIKEGTAKVSKPWEMRFYSYTNIAKTALLLHRSCKRPTGGRIFG